MSLVRPLHDEIVSLFKTGRRFRYRKGDVILREADGMTTVFYIESGYVKAYTLNEDGQENVVMIYKSGEIFPIAWVMSENMRTIFYEAISPVIALRITRETLAGALDSPGSTFARHLLNYAADQLVMLTDRIDNLQFTSAYQRVIYRILFLADRFGVVVPDGIIVDIVFTQQDIANSINLSRETTSRMIEKLENQQLIAYRERKFYIPDIERLKAELGQSTQ